jgi:hypothetical protein
MIVARLCFSDELCEADHPGQHVSQVVANDAQKFIARGNCMVGARALQQKILVRHITLDGEQGHVNRTLDADDFVRVGALLSKGFVFARSRSMEPLRGTRARCVCLSIGCCTSCRKDSVGPGSSLRDQGVGGVFDVR